MKEQKEAFEVNDRVLLNPNHGSQTLKLGQPYNVEACMNGSTTLTGIEETISTENLILCPDEEDRLIEFAINIIGDHLVTVVEGAKLCFVSQVYFRNILAKRADYELPNPHMIEILGKQFVKRSIVNEIYEARLAKKMGGVKQMQAVVAPPSDNEFKDDFENVSMAELKNFARQIPTIKISQSKKDLIADLRAHRAAKK